MIRDHLDKELDVILEKFRAKPVKGKRGMKICLLLLGMARLTEACSPYKDGIDLNLECPVEELEFIEISEWLQLCRCRGMAAMIKELSCNNWLGVTSTSNSWIQSY